MRHFNTGGPCMAADHHMVPPTSRLPGLRGLVEQKLYFTLHAPRRVGKTASLIAFARTLTDEGRFASVRCARHHR